MSEQEMMLRKLSSYEFACWEMRCYLDTHPSDKEAFKMHEEYLKKYKLKKAEYEAKYGPLNSGSGIDKSGWDWLDEPWPWENERMGK